MAGSVAVEIITITQPEADHRTYLNALRARIIIVPQVVMKVNGVEIVIKRLGMIDLLLEGGGEVLMIEWSSRQEMIDKVMKIDGFVLPMLPVMNAMIEKKERRQEVEERKGNQEDQN
jgi:hypothetical protein